MDELTPKPRRYWRPSFGLRSLFVLVVIAAIPCAWAGCALKWIQERKQFVLSFNGRRWDERLGQMRQQTSLIVLSSAPASISLPDPIRAPIAPGGMWLFGEKGVFVVYVPSVAEIERAKQLFPESVVMLPED